MALGLSHRVPREYVARALQRRERGRESALELLVDLVRCPAVGALQGADRARLIEQIDLVVAYREYLSADARRLVRGEIDHQRRDLLRRHFSECREMRLL